LNLAFEDLGDLIEAPLAPRTGGELRRFWQWLEEANGRTNLTRITGEQAFLERHALDALCGLALLDEVMQPGASLVDVGSGCGVPGFPLAIARPEWSVLLVETARRKATELEAFARTLPNVSVRCARAEDCGRDPALRETHQAAVVRAVGSVALTLELTLPLVSVGGVVLLYRGTDGEQALDLAAGVAPQLGGGALTLREVSLPSGAARHLLLVQKVEPTPARYPRRAGIPGKRPLTGRS
jgi:16S rRNA (guanine527-N7)-methyltransferase